MVDPTAVASAVLGRYTHAVGRGTASDVGQCFSEDAQLKIGSRAIEGRESIQAFYQELVIDDLRTRCEAMRHRMSSLYADVDGARVRAIAFFDVDAHVPTAQESFWGEPVPADSIVRNAGRYDAVIAPEQSTFDLLQIVSQWVSVRPRVQTTGGE